MRGRGPFRRPPSPGRWGERGESPVKQRGGSDSPAYGRSPVRSRSRSPQHRGRFVRPPPNRQPPSPGLRARPQSFSSGSQSGSESETSSGSAPPRQPPPLPGQYRKEQLVVKNREREYEREILGRIQDLEDLVAQERAAKDTLLAKTDFLSEKVKSIAERSKSRGLMLVQLLSSLRKVEESKRRVQEAEEELAQTVEQATALMHDVDQTATKDNRNGAPELLPVKEQGEKALEMVASAEPVAGNQHSGWLEGAAPDANASQSRMPVKFKIKL